MNELQRRVISGNPVSIGFEMERLINEGWEIDPEAPLTWLAYGTLECNFVRDPANAPDAPPKKTRAEILADARAAKALKKRQEGAEKGVSDE